MGHLVTYPESSVQDTGAGEVSRLVEHVINHFTAVARAGDL